MPSQASDNWQVGAPYERYVGRWSRRVAPAFLEWLDVPPAKRWVDVGCGTGALCAAIFAHGEPAALTGVEPSEGFLEVARRTLPDRVDLRQGSADALPIPDASVDAVVSGLVLNFIPDLPAALREARRVSGTAGTFAAYVWDYAGRMQLMRHFWDAAAARDPAAAPLDEGTRFPLCRPEALRSAVEAAGFGKVQSTGIEVDTRFDSFEDFWEPFLGGQGPAPAYVMSLEEGARESLRQLLRERLPTAADGTISLIARAWAVRGSV